MNSRFQFGKNWRLFLKNLDKEKINESKCDLLKFLKLEDLENKSFLDIGSGSGLSSLSAIKSGAKVYSFDYDKLSVECTKTLKDKFFEGNQDVWTIERGSAIDEEYMNSLPKFDVVYSWGVLHHTGDMWKGLELIEKRVKFGGLLYIALYNDQGVTSKVWEKLKKIYVSSNKIIKIFIILIVGLRLTLPSLIKDTLKLRPLNQFKNNGRGMSRLTDVIDWVGGYPFEVSKPEDIILFFNQKGFKLENLKTCGGGKGCNEFLFLKI